MCQLRTKNTGHGSPLYYFYMNEDEYPDIVGNKISNENITLFLKGFFKNKNAINIIKNKDFKRADLVYFPKPNMYGVSQKFKNSFEDKLKAEFFKTNLDGYFLMIIDNVIDCVDKEKSQITYIYPDRRCAYERPAKIVLNEKIVENELLFSIPEEPLKTFCTEKFMKMCEEYNMTNMVFEDLNPYS